jgi:hypothetical protein
MRSKPCHATTRSGLVAVLPLLAASLLPALPARALDLEDLNVPPLRLRYPDGTSRWYTPPEPANTNGWTVYNVANYMGACSLADNSVDDESCVDAANDAARRDPNPVVLYFPAGTYNFPTPETIWADRDDFVIRCEDPATTTLKFSGADDRMCVSGLYNVCFQGAPDTNTVGWTGGFDENTTALTVTDASPFNVGEWVVATHAGGAACYDGTATVENFRHHARVVAKSGNTITIDRPLRMDYTTDPDCGAKTVSKANMTENVGIESCTIFHTNPSIMGWKPAIGMEHVANGWITDMHIQNYKNVVVRFKKTARAMIAHSKVEDVFVQGQWNSQGVNHVMSTDTYVINNVFEDVRVASECEEGSESSVFAYNYQVPGFFNRERSHFMHGKNCRENLVEGNHVDATIQGDSYWGRQGPRNTLYRNRVVYTGDSEWFAGRYFFPTHVDRFNVADQMTLIANTTNEWMASVPGCSSPGTCHDVDNTTTNFHFELNTARTGIRLTGPEPTTNCADGAGNRCNNAAGAGFIGRNFVGAAAPVAWNGISIPDSLFLTGVPSWWCREACPFDESGIGALGDNWNAGLCKLPAQIREEGGTCTPVSGSGAPVRPAAPFLLP